MKKRIVFLDYLRLSACLMVMLVHACECFYFGDDGGLGIASRSDAFWTTAIDSACRAAVPLFVIASAYLLLPLSKPTGEFFRRRFLRVAVPFAVWCCVYTLWNHGEWGRMAFNFPMATGGHLWFVPMLLGLYLFMPILSPWAERVSEKELRGWLILWLFTTLFPFIRWGWACLYGNGWSHVFGEGNFDNIPFLWGECPWNSFGTFHYVSGFIGYLLLGLWFRKFAGEAQTGKTLTVALPSLALGWAIVWAFFYARIPGETFPVTAPYAKVVDLEMSWEFCSTGVALTVIGYFALLRLCRGDGAFYQRLVKPLSEASYGAYLVHILVLIPIVNTLKPHLPTPLTIVASAAICLVASMAISRGIQKIPRVGKYICG